MVMKLLRILIATTCFVACGATTLGRARAQEGTTIPLPAEDAAAITALLGPGVVGQALPSSPIQDPTIYFPLQERVQTYQVTGGKKAGESQTLGVARGKRPNGNPAWRFGIAPDMAAFVRHTDAGDLMMPAVTDGGEGVVVVTTPANPFLLKGMKPGETRTYNQSVSVNYLDDPTSQDYSGSLTTSHTYVGTYQVTVPAGTFPAILIRQVSKGKVGPAHTDDTAYYFFAPQAGIVAMLGQEDVEAFWIIHLDTKTGKVLAGSQ
jgi:hypothetical protein